MKSGYVLFILAVLFCIYWHDCVQRDECKRRRCPGSQVAHYLPRVGGCVCLQEAEQ